MINKIWTHTAIVWLLVVSLFGLLLRWMMFEPTGFNFKFMLHAHSHLAFLGWVFTALFALLIYYFLVPNIRGSKCYYFQFILFQVANVGMMVSFPMQGYGLFSIAFSTLHIFISFWFAFCFLRDLKKNDLTDKGYGISFKFVQASIFFMLLSSLGPFSLGPIMAHYGHGTSMYFNAIYFFLHFQYNGWFTFAVIGIFFRILEKNKIIYSEKRAMLLYRLFVYSCVPAYLLSVLWCQTAYWVYSIAIAAAIVQMVAVIVFLIIILNTRKEIYLLFNKISRVLLLISFFSFLIKILLQLLSGIPYFAALVYEVKNFIIAYLHLALLGFVSTFILAAIFQAGQLRNNSGGIILFLIGFFSTELVLVIQGICFWVGWGMIPHYYQILFSLSLFFPLSIGCILVRGGFNPKD